MLWRIMNRPKRKEITASRIPHFVIHIIAGMAYVRALCSKVDAVTSLIHIDPGNAISTNAVGLNLKRESDETLKEFQNLQTWVRTLQGLVDELAGTVEGVQPEFFVDTPGPRCPKVMEEITKEIGHIPRKVETSLEGIISRAERERNEPSAEQQVAEAFAEGSPALPALRWSLALEC